MRKDTMLSAALMGLAAAGVQLPPDLEPRGQTYRLKIPPRMPFRSRPPVRVKPSFPPDWVQAEKLAAAEAKRARKAAKRAAQAKGGAE